MRPDNWNRCDDCGRFIAFYDFKRGAAVRRLLTPDALQGFRETWETLCPEHASSKMKAA